MKTRLAWLTTALLFAGCGASDEPTTTQPPDTVLLVRDTEHPATLEWKDPGADGLGGTLYRVEIDGMDCILWKQRVGTSGSHGAVGYGGITCNWPREDSGG